MEKKQKNLRGILAYCIGDIYGGGAFVVVGTLFLRFLTDSVLISAGIAGTMLLVGKIWDAIIDPFIGNLTDHSPSKYGRRRVFFLAGVFHIGAAFVALWLPIQGSLVIKVIYYVMAYMLFATSFSLTMVPYHAYLADITRWTARTTPRPTWSASSRATPASTPRGNCWNSSTPNSGLPSLLVFRPVRSVGRGGEPHYGAGQTPPTRRNVRD